MLYGVLRRSAAGMMNPWGGAGLLGEDVRNLGFQFHQASRGVEIGSAESEG